MAAVERREPGALRELGRLSSIGVQFAVTVALCVGAGWWADARLGTSPWLLLAAGLVGGVAAFYQVYRALVSSSSAAARDAEEDEVDAGGGAKTHRGETN